VADTFIPTLTAAQVVRIYSIMVCFLDQLNMMAKYLEHRLAPLVVFYGAVKLMGHLHPRGVLFSRSIHFAKKVVASATERQRAT
jgi:hypothetical protein